MLLFFGSKELVPLNQNVVSVNDGFDFNLFSQKAVLFIKSVKISDCFVHRGKTPLQKPSSIESVFAVRMFFQAQECLYVQARLPWCCGT